MMVSTHCDDSSVSLPRGSVKAKTHHSYNALGTCGGRVICPSSDQSGPAGFVDAPPWSVPLFLIALMYLNVSITLTLGSWPLA